MGKQLTDEEMAAKAAEREMRDREKSLEKLKEKGFKNYEFKVGDKKISDKGILVPYKCKNLTGIKRDDASMTDTYFAQTNKGAEMGKKLLLRQMRQDSKMLREKRKALRNDISMLKGDAPKSKKKK